MPRVLPRLSRRAFIAGTPMISVAAAQVSSFTRRSEVNSLPSGSRVISIEAKPDRVDVDLAKTAIIVVDMQNDFAAKGGLVNRLRLNSAHSGDPTAPLLKFWLRLVPKLKSFTSKWGLGQSLGFRQP